MNCTVPTVYILIKYSTILGEWYFEINLVLQMISMFFMKSYHTLVEDASAWYIFFISMA